MVEPCWTRLCRLIGIQTKGRSIFRYKKWCHHSAVDFVAFFICRLSHTSTLFRPFITAALMGATNVEQLDQNVGALDVVLPDECLAEVIAVSAENVKHAHGRIL